VGGIPEIKKFMKSAIFILALGVLIAYVVLAYLHNYTPP
jgi:hypothetical protein